jgi:hypothetical protein
LLVARIFSTFNPVAAVVRALVDLLGLAVWLLLAGCQTLGPTALGVGRGAYNDVIARTSSEQTLGLLVRGAAARRGQPDPDVVAMKGTRNAMNIMVPITARMMNTRKHHSNKSLFMAQIPLSHYFGTCR